ncbi:OVCH2 [Bugula neritina]|uniref:OVCH2 n=1 Tax=Bugula neritina TaxID=10212 RepID=A0A7J7JA49_BUGNE|nr:OVCH2 [Bugula neritina]
MSPDLAEALRKSDTEFPWVVSIHQKEKKCQGAIVDEEWVITSINCVDHKHFYTNFEEDALTVVAGEGTSSRQSRNVYKVIRNHFEAVSGLSPYDNVILLQVFPLLNSGENKDKIQSISRNQPALLPHYNCFAAGYNAETKKTEHVRVVLETDESNCGSEELRNGTACFNYPHSGKSKACLDSVGSPISCLDPVTNSWTLSAILSTKIGCGINKRQALHFDQMPVYYWANIITSLRECYVIFYHSRAELYPLFY